MQMMRCEMPSTPEEKKKVLTRVR
ncbi:regulator protein FrmR, partial [Salmonella enterica subsp. enterica serovar Typhimurium]|nr:regulator protein FrmR [Salmonella enterica subsp. enterica serovar Typhimurium]